MTPELSRMSPARLWKFVGVASSLYPRYCIFCAVWKPTHIFSFRKGRTLFNLISYRFSIKKVLNYYVRVSLEKKKIKPK